MDYKINIGDKVMCIDGSGYDGKLSKGKLYTIIDIYTTPTSDSNGLFIDVINDIGYISSPKLNRFDCLNPHRNNIIDEILK